MGIIVLSPSVFAIMEQEILQIVMMSLRQIVVVMLLSMNTIPPALTSVRVNLLVVAQTHVIVMTHQKICQIALKQHHA